MVKCIDIESYQNAYGVQIIWHVLCLYLAIIDDEHM